MPDVELAQRYLRLSDESRRIVRRLLALQRDAPSLRHVLPAGKASEWRQRANWVMDYLHGLDEQMTRHTALQGELQEADYDEWRQKAERLAAEWVAFNASGSQLLAEATPLSGLTPSGEVRDESASGEVE